MLGTQKGLPSKLNNKGVFMSEGPWTTYMTNMKQKNMNLICK